MARPYTAFYTENLRLIASELPEASLRLWLIITSYGDDAGVCYPGVRELSSMSKMRVQDVLDALADLEVRCLIVYLRRNERDPLTGRIQPNVYGLNPDIYLARNPSDALIQVFSQFRIITTTRTNTKNQHQEPPPPTSAS